MRGMKKTAKNKKMMKPKKPMKTINYSNLYHAVLNLPGIKLAVVLN